MLKLGAILPHPPILVPEIGGEETKRIMATTKAIKKVAKDFSAEKIETVIIISPHAPLISEAFILSLAEKYEGDFSQFGFSGKTFEFEGNLELAEKIKEKALRRSSGQAHEKNIPLMPIQNSRLDHGALVPLYFLSKKQNFKIVLISYSILSHETHLKFGEIIKEIAENSKENIALVASGDLSHCLTKEAPAPYNPAGPKFDARIKELLKTQKFEEIINLDENLVEQAAECGYRSILILLGAIKDLNLKAEVLSYEGPFGVGYLVAKFTPTPTFF